MSEAGDPGRQAVGTWLNRSVVCPSLVAMRPLCLLASVVHSVAYSSYKEIGPVLLYFSNKTNVKIVNVKCILIWLS